MNRHNLKEFAIFNVALLNRILDEIFDGIKFLIKHFSSNTHIDVFGEMIEK